MAQERIDILLPGPLMDYAVRGLRERFTLHRLDEAADRDALLTEIGGRVRGLASFGSALVDEALLAALPALEIVSTMAVGYDSIDAAACARAGVYVTHAPGVLTDEVADTAMGLLLMAVRELSAAERYLRAGRWQREGSYPVTRGSLKGRRLGILGLGRIGRAIAARAEPFGLAIHYHNRRPVEGVPYAYHDSLLALAEAVDTLVVVAPGGAETRHLVDASVLRALGSDGVLVNIGRGSVVDEAALAAALADGTILGAGLDVFEDEPRVHPALLDMDNVVLLPHVGSASVPTREAMAQLMIDNLVAWFDEGRVITPVPETPFPDTHALAERGGG